MAIRKSASSGIPFGGTSGRPANPINGQPYFNGDIGRLELYTSATGWQNIVQETPGVASATGTYNLPYIIVRPTNNYGVGQYVEKLIPKACKMLYLGRKIVI